MTADQTAVSNPVGLSINNAFGRLWPVSAPYGIAGPGTSSIDDPDGRPLKGAPNPRTGGVYFADLTGRQPAQIIPGALAKAAVGTAFLGGRRTAPAARSSASSWRTAASCRSTRPRRSTGSPRRAPSSRSPTAPGGARGAREHGLTPRLGAVVNYEPTLVLYVNQPLHDSVKAIGLAVGGPPGDEVFVPTTTRLLRSRALHRPVDLAPVVVETEDPHWASNTTLEEGSDLYVCNGEGATVVRMRQDGTAVAVRRIRARHRSLGDARLNGIATSPDGTRIWLTYVGRLPGSGDREGGVLELPAF